MTPFVPRFDDVQPRFARAAVEDYERVGYPCLLACPETDLGSWLTDRQRCGEAVERLESAAEVFGRIGARPALRRVRAQLDSDDAGEAGGAEGRERRPRAVETGSLPIRG